MLIVRANQVHNTSFGHLATLLDSISGSNLYREGTIFLGKSNKIQIKPVSLRNSD